MSRRALHWAFNLCGITVLTLAASAWGHAQDSQKQLAFNYSLFQPSTEVAEEASVAASSEYSADLTKHLAEIADRPNQVDGQLRSSPPIETVHTPILAVPSSRRFSVPVRATQLSFLSPQAIVLSDIYFDDQRQAIDGEAAAAIQQSAALIQRHHDALLEIEAHCDARGNDAYNMALGFRRAQRVMDYVSSLGLPRSQVATLSYGELTPRCTERHVACWEDNLRLQHVFSFLAIGQSRLGCVTRLQAHSASSSILRPASLLKSPFLQRIHLAEPSQGNY